MMVAGRPTNTYTHNSQVEVYMRSKQALALSTVAVRDIYMADILGIMLRHSEYL